MYYEYTKDEGFLIAMAIGYRSSVAAGYDT